MKKLVRILFVFGALAAMTLVGWYVFRREYNNALLSDIAMTTVDKTVFRPYVLGTDIVFANGGNSDDFINVADGWGEHEPMHRCAVGAKTIMRLYIPNGAGSGIRLIVDAFGVYNPSDGFQTVNVYANDKHIATWNVGHDGPFVANIPESAIPTNTLILRFDAARPYSPPGDRRKLGMAVRSIKIDRIFAGHTKQKIGRWIKKNIMDGGIRQEYDTSTSGSNDVWM